MLFLKQYRFHHGFIASFSKITKSRIYRYAIENLSKKIIPTIDNRF